MNELLIGIGLAVIGGLFVLWLLDQFDVPLPVPLQWVARLGPWVAAGLVLVLSRLKGGSSAESGGELLSDQVNDPDNAAQPEEVHEDVQSDLDDTRSQSLDERVQDLDERADRKNQTGSGGSDDESPPGPVIDRIR